MAASDMYKLEFCSSLEAAKVPIISCTSRVKAAIPAFFAGIRPSILNRDESARMVGVRRAKDTSSIPPTEAAQAEAGVEGSCATPLLRMPVA
jgi:hypothetical protein